MEIPMQKLLFALSLGIAAVVLALHAANAQSTTASCAEHKQVVERLANKYGETRQSYGLARNNSVLEVFASQESGTWTIILTLPDGTSCLVAAGEAFEAVNEEILSGEKA